MTTRDDRDEIVGLRPEDLHPEERAAVDESDEARREHAEAVELGLALRDLAPTPGPPLVRAMAHRQRDRFEIGGPTRPWNRWPVLTGAVLAFAAAGLLVVLPTWERASDGIRPDSVELAANVLGDRVLEPGARVLAGEQVVLRVTSTATGYLVLIEEGRGAIGDPLLVEPGTHEITLGAIESRTETGRADVRMYRAILCESPEATERDLDQCAIYGLPLEVSG